MQDWLRLINHGLFSAFVERWHAETSSFHLLIGDISITLDHVSCLVYFLIQGKLLNYSMIAILETLDIMVTYLGVDPRKSQHELDDTKGCHARFSFLVDLYEHH